MKRLAKLECPPFLLLKLTVVLAILFSVQAYRQEVTLYESFDDDGDYHVYRSQVPDSTFLGSRVKRACVVGFWVFYKKVNYEEKITSWWGDGGHMVCGNISFPIVSFRYTEQAGATFFSGTNYEGDQTTVTSLGHRDMVGQSYTIRGTLSWTIYEGSDFDGQHKCITLAAPSFIAYRRNLYPGWSNFGSVAWDCVSEGHADSNLFGVKPSQNDTIAVFDEK